MMHEQSLSNVTLEDEKIASFSKYARYGHEWGMNIFTRLDTITWVYSNLILLESVIKEVAYPGVLFIHEMTGTACIVSNLKNK